MYSSAILVKFFLKENKWWVWCFSDKIYIMNYIFVLLHFDIWYHIHYFKCTSNILGKCLYYLLFYMKPDTISIIISDIADL